MPPTSDSTHGQQVHPHLLRRLTEKDRASLLLEAWKKAVDTEAHFNDIEMRIRNLALTLSGAVFAFGKILDKDLEGYIFLALVGIVSTFWFMDKHWYHRLLLGAVDEATRLERELSGYGIAIRLTETISKKSPFVLFKREVHSKEKIDVFYLALGTMALIAAGVSLGGTCIRWSVGFVVLAWSARILWWRCGERLTAYRRLLQQRRRVPRVQKSGASV